MKKKVIERVREIFGNEKVAKKMYEKHSASEIWEKIPEYKKTMKFHSFQTFLSSHFKKLQWGGKRPNSGQKKRK